MKTCKYWYRWLLQKVKKSTKFQSNADILDGDMTSSNLKSSDILWRHNSVNRDDVVLKLSQFTSLHRAYLLVKFHDDRRSGTFWTKSPSFQIGLGWKWHFFDNYDVIIRQQNVGKALNLAEWWILSRYIFYAKIKSFCKLYDTSCSQELQHYEKIWHWWRHKYVKMLDMPQNFFCD